MDPTSSNHASRNKCRGLWGAVIATLLLTSFSWTTPCVASESEAAGTETPAPVQPRTDRPTAVPESPPPSPKAEAAKAPRRIWYGEQILPLDGAAVALGVLGASGAVPSLTIPLGLATYAFGGPIVHFAHGNVAKGFGSMGLRIALPMAGFLTGYYAIDQCGGELIFCDLTGATVGLVVGALAAMVIDGALLSYKEVPRKTAQNRSSGFESLVVLPSLTRESASVSMSAAF